MNDKITSTENADPTPDEPSSPNGLESGQKKPIRTEISPR